VKVDHRDARAHEPREGEHRHAGAEKKIDGLVVAGLTELALGALTGWPMSGAVTRPHDLPKLGVRSGARLRQWHLDLIMLGSLTAAAPRLVPSPSREVGVPLAVGTWVNANAFGVLAFRPDLKDHPVYRASVATPHRLEASQIP
jgi:hypothetical protein